MQSVCENTESEYIVMRTKTFEGKCVTMHVKTFESEHVGKRLKASMLAV